MADFMPTFMVVEKGSGDGCDYTIGCNMRFRIVTAPDRETAVRDAIENAVFHGGTAKDYEDQIVGKLEEGLEVVELYVIPFDVNDRVDVEVTRREHNARVRERQAAKADAAERAELERLQRKFGKKL